MSHRLQFTSSASASLGERESAPASSRDIRPSNLRRDAPLRILVVTSTFPRWENDTEPRFVLDLCRELSTQGKVLVLAPHTPGAARSETLEGVTVRRFRYFIPCWQAIAYDGGITARLRQNPWRMLQLPFFFAALWLLLRRLTRSWAPDVIHAHWIIPQGLVACLAAGNVPIVCTSHGGDLHGLRGPLFRWLKAWTLRHCHLTTVVSDSMLQRVRALATDRPAATVIPMGTNLTSLFVPPSKPAERDRDHIVFVGRLVEKKGVEYLLEALAVMKQSNPTLRLTVAGDGPLKGELEQRAVRYGLAGRVTFLGSVRHSELPDLYQRATVAVFPFVTAKDGDEEGFGLVVVEAMGCGCPVIASDLPAIRQSIDPGVTGILTRPGDVEALATAVRGVVADPALRKRLADAALARSRTDFDWSSIGLRYWQTIRSVARRPEPRTGNASRGGGGGRGSR